MRQICVLLTKYSDWLSAVVCHVSGRGFTHSSISLDEDPDTYYSFNFRGFAVETAEKHRRRGVRNSRCIQLQISDAAYTRLRMRLLDMLAHRAEYHYTLAVRGGAAPGQRRGSAAARPLPLSARPVCRGAA